MVRVFSHYVSARKLVLIFVEALLIVSSVRIGLWLHRNASGTALLDSTRELPLVIGLGLCMLVIMNGMGLYERSRDDAPSHARARVIAAVAIAFAVTAIAMPLLLRLHLGIDGLLAALAIAITGSSVLRVLFSKWVDGRLFARRVLVLGEDNDAARLTELARRDGTHRIVGCVSPVTEASMISLLDKCAVDEVLIAVKDRRGGGLPLKQLLDCRVKGVPVTDLSTFFEREHRQILLDSLNPSWMVFGDGFRQGYLRTLTKRIFDVTASAGLALLTLPVILLASLSILAESGWPIVYRQERVGYGGHVFTIYKLRSMKTGTERDGLPRWASANDARTTRVGRVLRKLRIDELPQIFNVLKGDMALVGPRPERPFFVESLAKQIPYYDFRHKVKPGITGWAQVRYPYGASVQDAIEKLQYDLYYVKNHTLFLDLIILVDTIPAVLWGDGSGARSAHVPDGRSPSLPLYAGAQMQAEKVSESPRAVGEAQQT